MVTGANSMLKVIPHLGCRAEETLFSVNISKVIQHGCETAQHCACLGPAPLS